LLEDDRQALYTDKPKNYYQGCNMELLQYLDPQPESVLDVGCAEGLLGEWIKKNRGCRVTGIELSPDAARSASDRLDEVLVGNIETMELPFSEGTFDHIIFGDVLEHLTDPWRVLKKVAPLLRPGGSVIACIPNIGHISVIADLLSGQFRYVPQGLLDKTHLRFFTRKGIEDLFQECGYVITHLHAIAFTNDYYESLIAALERVREEWKLGLRDFPQSARSFQYILRANTVNTN
jgi:2-polyprenyl-3-methyl-5-hydroxy-6-metoxy-1,4-benzoquinol methylase